VASGAANQPTSMVQVSLAARSCSYLTGQDQTSLDTC